MTRVRHDGGVSGSANQPNTSIASGIWTLKDAEKYQRSNQWPVYVPPASSDTYFNYTTILLHGDGTNGANNSVFVDSSVNAATITRLANTAQGAVSPYRLTGWSNYFPTTSDYFSFSDTSAGVFGTGNFTVEFWLFSGASPGATSGFNVSIPSPSTNSWGIITYNNTIIWHFNGSNFLTTSTVAVNTPMSVWNHVAAVKNGTTLTIYFNGTSVGTITDNNNYSGTPTRIIGPNAGGTGGFYVSNFRIIKGTALYTTSFTPSTTPLTNVAGTTFLTCQSNRFLDTSAAAALTITGTPLVQSISPFAPSGAYSTTSIGGSVLVGQSSSDGLTIPYSTSTSRFTGDFTVECWFYMNNTTGTQTIFTQRTTSYVPFLVWVSSGTLTLYMSSANASWDLVNAQSLGTVKAGQWYHYALVRSGSSIKSYLNGAVVGAGATSSATLDSSTLGLRIGCTSATEYFNGYISNVRMVNGTAVYTSAFTPPTAPSTAITNTTFLLNATNAGIFNQTSKNVLNTFGSAAISTAQSKFGVSSISFNGTSDYLLIPNTSGLNLLQGDFTIEAWIYVTSSAASGFIITFGNEAATRIEFGYNSSRQLILDIYGVGTSTFTGSAFSLNTWTHVAFVRSGSTITGYINGTSTGTTSSSAILGNATGGITIGRDNSTTYFTGYIDDLRVTKYARYTSGFTAPTSAFLDQ